MDFSDYPRPSLAVDVAVLTVIKGQLSVVLVQRAIEPDAGLWALPGVFVGGPGETFEEAAERALRDKAHLTGVGYLEQVPARNHPDRDPRGWVVSLPFLSLVEGGRVVAAASSQPDTMLAHLEMATPGDRPQVRVLRPGGEGLNLAFDHQVILTDLVQHLQRLLGYGSVADDPRVPLSLVPERFTLKQLQDVYEALLSRSLSRDAFRKHVIMTRRMVRPTGQHQADVGHRPAELYEPVGL